MYCVLGPQTGLSLVVLKHKVICWLVKENANVHSISWYIARDCSTAEWRQTFWQRRRGSFVRDPPLFLGLHFLFFVQCHFFTVWGLRFYKQIVIMVYTMHYRCYNILSLNVNGLNNPIKHSKMIAKMKKEKINIAFWQETHMSGAEHEKLKKLCFRNTFFSSYKREVGILISDSTPFEYISEIRDKWGRFVLVKGKIDQKEVTLFNIYAPPGSEA